MDLICNLASLLKDHKSYDRARLLYERLIQYYEASTFVELELRANAVSNLAMVYSEWKGTDHQLTLSTIERLAHILQQEYSYEEARVLYESVLAGYEKTLSGDHPTTLNAALNLAILLWKLSERDEVSGSS